MPGTRITDEDRRKIHREFICTSCDCCDLLLSTPMYTSCGHWMCASCVDALLESSNPRCPFDGTELRKEEIFPDAFIKRETQALSLYCANSGCHWYGTYVELEAHSPRCVHGQIKCVHPQCKMNIQASNLGEHLRNECEYHRGHVRTGCEATPVTCKYCKQKILRRDIESHEQLCEEIPGECKFQATSRQREPRQHANNGLIANVCLLLTVCLNLVSDLASYVIPQGFTPAIQKICGLVYNIHTELREILRRAGHQRTPHADPMAGTQRKPNQHMSNYLIANVRHWLQSSLELGDKLVSYAIGLEYRFLEIYERIEEVHSGLKAIYTNIIQRIPPVIPMHLNDSLIDHGHLLPSFIQNMVSELDHDISEVRSCLAEKFVMLVGKLTGLERRIEGLESGGGHGRASDEIRELRASIQNKTTEISSLREKIRSLEREPREKDAQIDRMRSRMDQIDESLALNTVKITDLESQRGPRVQQPMKLLDQGNGDHMVDAFHSDLQSSSFQRLKSDMNIASGSPLFMPIDSSSNRLYNDVLFIKIDIVD